ncbi:MAG: glycosyltransferase family 2 protein [Desulfovibrio sp.]|jgi:glycosyltransferase involved in cell wall biosynthesis|nr:glycosyltransferase family 2 protein [Desulfovibrio sp.]
MLSASSAPEPDPAENPLRPGLCGVVLTLDGERLLERCLASLAFCDEILVVDCGSVDSTLAICAKYSARVLQRDWDGFAGQFRFAQDNVQRRWFFILDQDEICPPALGGEILRSIERAEKLTGASAGSGGKVGGESVVAFSVGRRSWYLNRFMKHSGWHPDHITRVFCTGHVEFHEDAHIHYRPLGKAEHIGAGPDMELIHYPYTGFFHQLEKLNSYAERGAKSLRAHKQRGGIARGIGHGMGRFIRIYILKRGFLDGRAGFLVACHGAFYAFLKYVRVLEASWGDPYDHK